MDEVRLGSPSASGREDRARKRVPLKQPQNPPGKRIDEDTDQLMEVDTQPMKRVPLKQPRRNPPRGKKVEEDTDQLIDVDTRPRKRAASKQPRQNPFRGKKVDDDTDQLMEVDTEPMKRVPLKRPRNAPGKQFEKGTDQLMEVDTSAPSVIPRIEGKVPFTEKPAALEERNGDIEIRVVNNDKSIESTTMLIDLQNVIGEGLPEMGAAYITRVVFDHAHVSLVLVKKQKVVAGITFRPFNERKFAEIVFCVVANDAHTKGYGAHLMAHLKDYVRASSPITHFLVYADDSAIGFFKKQGFTQKISLDEAVWMNVIKSYNGATFMECAMIPGIRYLEADRMLAKQKETVLTKMKASTSASNRVIHPPPAQWAGGNVHPIDPLSIPAIKATGWYPEMDKLARRRGPHFKELETLLTKITKNKHAWPFHKPVSEEEAPGYHALIESPMDLSKIEQKLENGAYFAREDFVSDLMLMFKNCRKYNGPKTEYRQAADLLQKHVRKLIKEMPEDQWRVVREQLGM